MFAQNDSFSDVLAKKQTSAYADNTKRHAESQYLSHIYPTKECDSFRKRIKDTVANGEAFTAAFNYELITLHQEAQTTGCAKNDFAESEIRKYRLVISNDPRCNVYMDSLAAEAKRYVSSSSGRYLVNADNIKASAKADGCLVK